MKNLSLFIVLVLGLSLSQCKKEDAHVWNDPNPPGGGNTGTNYSIDKGAPLVIDAFGLVRDESGIPLSGVTLTMSGKTYTSDANGMVKIPGAAANTEFAYIQAFKTGYFNGSRAFVPQPGINRFEITLMAKGVPQVFQANAGGLLQEGNAEVVMGKGYVDTYGNEYNGSVKAYIKHLDPNDPDINKIMPGDLRGANADGEKILVTYGMVAVELEGESGQKLQPASGKPATIKMTVPASMLASAPSKIPLWHFDEAKGIWGQEGEAQLVGGVYVGTVTHFSFWNCDTPLDFTKLIGKVTAEDGKVVPEIWVEIVRPSGDKRQAPIDHQGNFGGLIPAGENLGINFRIGNEIVASESFNSGNGLTISKSFTLPDISFATIYGTVYGCNGSLVPSGSMLTNYSYLSEIKNGQFSFRIYKNPAKVINLTAIYLSGGFSQTRQIALDKDEIKTLDFGLCPNGGATDDFEFSFTLEGQNYKIEGVKTYNETDSMFLFVGGKSALDFSTDHEFQFGFYTAGDWSTKTQFKLPNGGYFSIDLGKGRMWPKDVDVTVISKSPYNIAFSGTCTFYDEAIQTYRDVQITDGKIIEK